MSSCCVDLAEAVLPEPTPYRQQRIVLDDGGAIFNDLANSRALKLSRDFAGIHIENLANVRDAGGLLVEKYLSGNLFNLRVRERNTNGESVQKLVQQCHVGERTLPCPDDHDLAVELLGDGLSDFRHQHRTVIGIADVLLNLIKDE